MNAERRKVLEEAVASIKAVKEKLETVRDEEQAAYDNLPESFQQGEKGSDMENAISQVESAIDSLESAEGELEQID